MDYKNQITLVAVSLASTIGFAGTMGTVCTPGNVTTPCTQQQWGIGAEALYLQPNFSGLDYTTSIVSTTGDLVTYGAFNPSAGWGFKIEGFYLYNDGSDLNLNWYHLNNTSNRSVLGTEVSDRFLGPREIFNQYKTKWDAVNLEFGQVAQFGETKRIRFHAGLQYAHLAENYTLDIPLADLGLTPEQYTFDVDYDGIGPRAGMDGSYSLMSGFSIFGNIAGTLLIGRENLHELFQRPPLLVGAEGTIVPVTNFQGKRTQVIPEFEAKVGLNYTTMFMTGNVDLEAGWMFVNYFSAYTVPHAGPGASGTSDFSLNGPFVSLSWIS